MKQRILFMLIGSYIFLQSCGTSLTQMQVLQPAEFSIADHIEVIATVDRSKPSSGFTNVLEGLFTGENIGQDRRGRQSALDGLTNALTRTPRFQVRSTGLEYTGSKSGARMEAPLPWSEIERICSQHDADAALVLESFDTDQMVNTREVKYKEKVDGKEVEKIKYQANGNLNVKVGWRLYDPTRKIIVDDFVANAHTDVNGEGQTEEAARNNLPDQIRVTRDVSYDAGVLYGMRIAPVWVTVGRQFYTSAKKGDKEIMQRAGRYTQGDDWDQATEIWKELLNKAQDPKTQGKAAHNLAVAAERNGQLEYALDWAKKAYNEYNNKGSRDYIYQLQQRINDRRKVESQMGN